MQSKMEDKEKTDILLLENLSEFREELTNCSKFVELLSAGIDIFVNDAFSQSHRIHASTVAITRFCYACVVGFHFEEGLYQCVDREDQERSTPLDLSFKVAPAKLVSGSMQSKMEDKEKTDILLLENLSEFREELTNCSKFVELLSAGIDIFVNDAFSQSHRIHASTVAITRFCYACVAGFHFEEGLYQVKKAIKTNKKQFIAIVCL
ncbi:unnamed protein product [Camellia sinensis]